MRIYAHHGITEFVICLGYRGYVIKEYFANYFLHESDVTFDLGDGSRTYHDSRSQPWQVTLADTGEATMTGGRIKRIRRFLDDDEPFLLTYGDGVADIDVTAQIAFHREQGATATMTVVRPPARFGDAAVDGNRITGFAEKPQASSGFINGGFFVLEPSVLDLIAGDDTVWEREPLEGLSRRGELAAWRHSGFWQAMDTLRERDLLEQQWSSGAAPWKVWA
jgi:glucose-1-phosphate cytidylyltransferase